MKHAYWKLRLLVKWLSGKLHLNGVVNMIEYCDDCGRKQPLVWHAQDEVWLEVTGDVGGVLCPECFDKRAHDLGIMLYWRPEVEFRRST